MSGSSGMLSCAASGAPVGRSSSESDMEPLMMGEDIDGEVVLVGGSRDYKVARMYRVGLRVDG